MDERLQVNNFTYHFNEIDIETLERVLKDFAEVSPIKAPQTCDFCEETERKGHQVLECGKCGKGLDKLR